MKPKIGSGSEPAFQKNWAYDTKPASPDEEVRAEEVLNDFRNQLSSIVGNLSIFLETCKLETPSAYRLGNAREAARKAERLVQDLIEMAGREREAKGPPMKGS